MVLRVAVVVVAGVVGVLRAGAAEQQKVDFNRDVRPILSDACFTCHGPDDATRKGGLRLDLQEHAVKGAKSGKAAVVAGDPAGSELIRRLVTEDEDDRMPPEKTGKRVSAAQVEVLKRWIAQGAAYRGHWAFEAPVRPELPEVKEAGWARNPIDRLVLARLEREGLRPAAEAPRATLIRRVYLDLTGVPPTAAEVEAFERDPSPDAYEKVVDRALASPRYGERMAMSWLDGARYADSHGYQADWERYQWRWRDWVIEAFNANQPFDQFTVEQIAGDLLPGATLEQRIATGFNRNHRMNTEGGTIPEEWRTEYVIDRVDTVGQVWLGLTLGCARCHDHKFDPVSQREFYQLFAFFNNNAESGRGAEKAGNHEPAIRAPRAGEVERLKGLDEAIASAERVVREREQQLPELLAKWEAGPEARRPGVGWTVLEPGQMKSGANTAALSKRPDGSVFAAKRQASTDTGQDTYTVTFKLPADGRAVTGIRLEALPDEKLPGRGPGRSENGNFVLTDFAVEVDGKAVKLASASADFSQAKHPVAGAIDGDKAGTGWAVHPNMGVAHEAVFALETPVKVAAEKAGAVSVWMEFRSRFARHTLGRFRVSVTDAAAPHEAVGTPASVVAVLETPREKRTAKQVNELNAYFRERHAGALTEADRALAKARAERAGFEESIPTVMVMQDLPQPRAAHVLLRGEYDKPGEKVEPALPKFFGPMPEGAKNDRLGLARWMVKADNPLTARVAVNRFWERFFGVGIVKTSENFGSQADWPSHPELLDWLASEFVRIGWDVKGMQKLIVTSAAYRQSAAVTPALLERDPENRLLARGPRFRLQAEVIRDQALAVSGLLVEKLGGPSVRPYQPEGVWDETNVYGNLRNYKHDAGEGLYRRSLYTIWKRTAAPPGMMVFDMTGREVCTVKRSRTNTPLQALALMNEPTYVEAARVLGERMIREGGAGAAARVAWAFRSATGRTPDAEETAVLVRGLERRLAKYRADAGAARKVLSVGERKADPALDPAEVAAYAVTAGVILNLDEVVTRE